MNCGATLIGNHCHDCGQAAHIHRTLTAFWHDFTHAILHFEGKVWRTLPMLIFRPGQLTRRYIHGERARFVSPLALFLFSVFLMFGTFSWVGAPFGPQGQITRDGVAQTADGMKKELARVKGQIASLKEKRADLAEASDALPKIDEELKVLQRGADGLQKGLDISAGLKTGEFDISDVDIDTGSIEFDAMISSAAKNPTLILYKMQTNAYKYSWALIPMSLPFLWLIFAWRRQFKPYDHAVFITYSLSFVTLSFVMLALLVAAGSLGGAAQAALIIFPVHMFLQLKGAYELGIGSALWRAGFLAVSAALVLLVFALLLLALGVVG